MKIEKISISLPKDAMRFVEQYRKQHKLRSRSDVFAKAVRALNEKDLAEAYRASALENKKLIEEWDVTVGDGLEIEPW
jgi:metal-responsive CopG/Arc/MetJ family transcriptional regulator